MLFEQANKNVVSAGKNLGNITKANVLICFVAFVGLYYPDSKIPWTELPFYSADNLFPITISLFLAIGFAINGYCLWAFLKQRTLAEVYVNKLYPNTDESNKFAREIIKDNSVFELLFEGRKRGQKVPLLIQSFFFALNHTSFLLYIILLWRKSDSLVVSILCTAISLLYIACYWYYRNELRKLEEPFPKMFKSEQDSIAYISWRNLAITIGLTFILLMFKLPPALKKPITNDTGKVVSLLIHR